MLRTLLILGRVSNLPTVWTNVLVGWFLAGGAWGFPIIWLLLGISLIYIGGMTLNDAFDAEWDAQNAPERPIPSGKIKRTQVWMIGIAQLFIGAAISLIPRFNAVVWIGALITAVLLYDWLHKRWAGSVLIMGACRSLVYLAAATAATEQLLPDWPIWVMAAGMLLYIAGITLAARGERDTLGREPVLARILLTLPAAMVVLLSNLGDGSTRILGLIVGFALVFVWISKARLHLAAGKIGLGVTRLLAGIIVIDAVALFYADWRLALASLAVLLPLTILAQRRIPAT